MLAMAGQLAAPDQRRGHRGGGAAGPLPEGDKASREKPAAIHG